NPIDWKIRRGYLAGGKELAGPVGLGSDAAGVVDEVGEGVTDTAVGDEVFGLGSQTQAEYAVLRTWVAKPASVDWAVAAGAGVAGETAVRVLDLLGLGTGSTVLIDGASGGVGAIAVQVAVARGATVVGTASDRNHGYLSSVGALPVSYGPGLVERVRAAAPAGLDGVFDVVGKTPVEDLLALAPEPGQVVSIANFGAASTGIRATGGGEGEPRDALAEVGRLLAEGRLVIETRRYPFAEAAQAHAESEAGHVRGKLVLVP
ncbi:MAG: NADP-dependent oxidoreductase, partial [Actinomycetes bacterium]